MLRSGVACRESVSGIGSRASKASASSPPAAPTCGVVSTLSAGSTQLLRPANWHAVSRYAALIRDNPCLPVYPPFAVPRLVLPSRLSPGDGKRYLYTRTGKWLRLHDSAGMGGEFL